MVAVLVRVAPAVVELVVLQVFRHSNLVELQILVAAVEVLVGIMLMLLQVVLVEKELLY